MFHVVDTSPGANMFKEEFLDASNAYLNERTSS
jgi:hypothetical protein